MIYNSAIDKFGNGKKVTAAYIGAGHFGTAVIAQQSYVKDLSIPVVGDISKENARQAFVKAGIPEEKIRYFSTADEAEALLAEGLYLYTDNCGVIPEISQIDIICEGTGNPEAGAEYAMAALNHGKHLVMVSKELDSAVGPQLAKEAADRGLLYSPVDGDQHGLLIQMIEWAKLIGLTVISAGKSRDGEFVLDEENQTVSVEADGITIHESMSVKIPDDKMKYFRMIPEGADPAEYIKERAEVLKSLPAAGAFDLCEMTIAANTEDLEVQNPGFEQGILRITELPVALCTKENGGIYDKYGNVNVFTCLRRKDEAGMGGGVYLVVKCDNEYANYILTTKGQIPNYDLTTAVIYRPYHLCGVEVSTTLLCMGQLGITTGGEKYLPKYDLVKRALEDIPAGTVLGGDHDLTMEGQVLAASSKSPEAPVPAHLLNGCRTVCPIKKGQMITYSMIEDKSDSSLLWKLREEMESTFEIRR